MVGFSWFGPMGRDLFYSFVVFGFGAHGTAGMDMTAGISHPGEALDKFCFWVCNGHFRPLKFQASVSVQKLLRASFGAWKRENSCY